MNFWDFILFCLLTFFKIIPARCAEVVVKSSQGIQITSMRAQFATFSPSLPDARLVGYVVRSRPVNACSAVTLGPSNGVISEMELWLKPKILVLQQGPCSFIDQVRRAEEAGCVAVIIFSNSSDELVVMQSNDSENASIPAVFVGQSDGILLWDKYVWSTGYYVVISVERTKMTIAWELVLILIPASIFIIPLSALIIMTLMARRCPLFLTAYVNAKNRTRLITRLPERRVAKEEVVEDGPACSICLEYYKADDKIRKILPCSHEFHSFCVDPWLLGDNMVCPLCRREVRQEDDTCPVRKMDRRGMIYFVPLLNFSFTPIRPISPDQTQGSPV